MLLNLQFYDRKSIVRPQRFRYTIITLMQSLKRVFITGSNRGLGQQLVKLLHNKHPEIQLHISSRKSPSELTLQWEQKIPNHSLKCYQIDLNGSQSIKVTAQSLRQKGIQFDFIVANAAVGCDFGQTIPSYQVAHSTLKTNVDSTIGFIKSFLPLLSSTGQVVIVSAALGALTAQSQSVRNILTNPDITEDKLLQFSNEYVEAAKQKKMRDFNWSAYRTSKALINAWARFVLPRYLKQGQTSVAMHPGWCSTDMGGPNAFLTPQQGAELINDCLWLKQIVKDQFYNGKFCSYIQCQ